MRATIAILLGGAALLSACAPNEPPPPPPPPPLPANPMLTAPVYLQNAASSDQYEIQAGQLAQQMSQNPAVRSFGQMIVADHSRTTQQLLAAAQSAGIAPPPPGMLPEQQQMLDQLRSAGPNFDMMFRDQQISAHQQALALHQNYAAGGDVPALQTAASQIVPVIQQHLNAAQALGVNAPPPPPRGERG